MRSSSSNTVGLRGAAFGVLTIVAISAPAAAAPPCPATPLDCLAVSQFSATAAATSDTLLLASIALPVALELGRGLDGDTVLRRGGAYAGAIGGTALVAGVVKYTVRRARPYTHSADPAVVAFTRTASGNDHSFFSGHTSLAFAALTSGAMLYNPTSQGDTARLAVWATAGTLAAATGVLRVRAGRHFPSDVLTGALVGTAFGVGVTYAVAPDATLRGTDLAALGAGVAVGTLVTALLPMPRDVVLPLGLRDVAVAPSVGPHGAALTLSASLR